MLISESYRELNRRLHATSRFGERGDKWSEKTKSLAAKYQVHSILDYGCGKGALKRSLTASLTAKIYEYDPAIPEKSALPEPCDLVICTDVLEHIEPECLDEVVAHLKRLTRKALFLAVSTRPAAKHLEDGRNAHLVVWTYEAWIPLLVEGMVVEEHRLMADEFTLVLRPANPPEA